MIGFRMLAADGSVADAISNQTSKAPAPAAIDVGHTSPLASVFSVIVVLAILIFGIVFLVRFLKSRVIKRGTSKLETIAFHPITQNRSVALVKVMDQIYVLGVGDNVQLLDIIREPEQVSKLEMKEETQPFPFESLLRDKLDQMTRQRRQLESWDRQE